MSVEGYQLTFREFICPSYPEISSFSSVRVSPFYFYFCVIRTSVLSLSTWSLILVFSRLFKIKVILQNDP